VGIEIAISVIAVVVVALAFFLIPTILEVKRTVKALNNFIEKTEEELNPSLRSLKETLDNLNKILDDIQTVTDGTRQVGENLKEISDKISSLIESIHDVKKEGRATIVALKAGIREGVKVLIRNLTS